MDFYGVRQRLLTKIEGAWKEGGRGPCIWDAFESIPGKIHNGDTANFSCDHFHKFEEDIELMKGLHLKAYRFSISWSRIFPSGKGKVNEEGVAFYNNLIDKLLEAGIEPWITLYHWDLPLALQVEEDGWLNPKIADYFAEYARICYERFGDRVKYWITLNEPWVVAILGYGQGVFAPGRVSNTEPYIAAHHLLRAHAKSVKIYREEFQAEQKGIIGMSNNCDWREPLTNSNADKLAAERALEFFLAWFTDPLYFGEYPRTMQERLGDRLPVFTEDEKEMLKGSADYFGLNHYTTMFAADAAGKVHEGDVYGNGGISEDQNVNISIDPNWKLTEMKWAVIPWGCRKLLEWISERYENPPIFITENGCAFDDHVSNGVIHDNERIAFYREYIGECHKAIENGVDLRGYFAWSLMDNFEWASGYSKRFGMIWVDFDTHERIPKSSYHWYGNLVKSNEL